jgi:large subunit ribosomal protein L9
MLVILKKEVYNLGEAGQIVKVRNGYGRNFLIPQGFAIPAIESSVHILEHQKRMADAIRRKQLAGARALAEKIDKTELSFRRESGEDGKLFGSVTNRDIVDALAAEGLVVDRHAVQLSDPIRSIGIVEVVVRLHKEVAGKVRVIVAKA